MDKFKMELVDTCSMRSGVIFECSANNEKEALEKMYKHFPGGVCAVKIEKEEIGDKGSI